MNMEQEKLLGLIQRSREGDREAQDALIRAAQNRVYYHCKKMLKKEEDALDATQDVLLTMLTGLDKLREPAAFWGWVNGITANRCRHLLSAPHKEWQLPEDEEGGSILDSLENLDEQLVPDKALDNEETRRMILGLVDELPPEQRMCVLFYYYDEMSVRQIAEAMDTSEGTVKSRLNYARRAIKSGVEDYERKGIKLYSASPLLLLVYFLRQEAAQSALDGASAAAMAARLLDAAGGAASPAAGGTAAGAASAEGTAAGAGAAASSAGVSAKVLAAVLAGAVAVGGAAVGITAATGGQSRGPEPAVTATAPAAAEVPEAVPPESVPFGQANGFRITEPQAYEDLPLALVLGEPSLVALPSTCDITQPSISVSGPDEAGYVTYTVTYDITARSHLGSTQGSPALSCSILAQEYNLYDYYTGRLYLPEGAESGASGETRAGGTATVEHGGAQFALSFEKSWLSSMDTGSWVESTQSGLSQERFIDSAMSVTFVVRAPADYDGVLLGLNVTDPADPDKAITEAWNLETDDPSHYVFLRLSDAL